ncbi:Neuroendocrine convertase 2 [Sarcoptes scabiei]|uniref:Neuroendocrine convertase 2 n=1 Tax=Sarcoptes scabiei TaxID=52283 RepID=A0A834R5Q6_SARSC|nr:Neuroendocrine convertase 2 [Sarcoptes scabiei]
MKSIPLKSSSQTIRSDYDDDGDGDDNDCFRYHHNRFHHNQSKRSKNLIRNNPTGSNRIGSKRFSIRTFSDRNFNHDQIILQSTMIYRRRISMLNGTSFHSKSIKPSLSSTPSTPSSSSSSSISSSSSSSIATIWRSFAIATMAIVLIISLLEINPSNGKMLQSKPLQVFTNSFHVKFRQDIDHRLAHRIAKRHGFINLGSILGSQREYHFQHRALPQIRHKRSIIHYRQLKSDHLIESAQQQLGFRRAKRGYKSLSLDLQDLQPSKVPDDPFFQYQWYLKNIGQNGGKPKLDLNVEAAWAQGITGKNVTTAIMDDGVDYMHPDLRDNYNAKASYDFSSNDPYPYPRYTDDWFNSHGTRCAGEVAAKRDNGICGVGVAYDSKVAGIRMLDQPYMTDLIEANSMGHEPDLIDIYSASWGPTDDGKTVDGPRNATMRAIVRGVNEGRRGLGNIYVWASGDGGEDDDCNCDGYAASMWTISINSAINDGQNAHYDESCSSTLASTFSNGAKDPHTGVATTDLYGRCTKTHSGTSAAAPEAAGVFALALEANPNLTWRDVQHLCVLTSKRNSLYDSKKRFFWNMNGIGLEFNHLFGFGVLDAGAMVALSKQWKTVPPRYHCEAGSIINENLKIPNNKSLILKIKTDACTGTETEVNYIEHVQAVITLNSTRRGDVVLYLISSMGTKSMILSRRPNDDDSHDGFVKWPFMTTHTWGENPRGAWRLEVSHQGSEPQNGFIKEWILMIHGTKERPYKDLPVDDDHSKLAIVKKAHEDAFRNSR